MNNFALGTLATRQAPSLTLEMLATCENTQSDHCTSPCDFHSPRSKRVNRPLFEVLPGTSHRILPPFSNVLLRMLGRSLPHSLFFMLHVTTNSFVPSCMAF